MITVNDMFWHSLTLNFYDNSQHSAETKWQLFWKLKIIEQLFWKLKSIEQLFWKLTKTAIQDFYENWQKIKNKREEPLISKYWFRG